MRAFTRRHFRREWRHRLGAAAVCLAYLTATLPLPLPAAVNKDASQPFPCQDHPCGCRTAEQCWRSCCCFTPAERWAWARAHHVEPPAYAEKPSPVEETAPQGWNTVKLRDRAAGKSEKKSACCERGRPTAKCCQTETRRACCEKETTRPAEKPTTGGTRLPWGSVMAAWQCRGLSTLWVSVGAVLPVAPAPAWAPDEPPPSRVALIETTPRDVRLNPPVPPPRPPLL